MVAAAANVKKPRVIGIVILSFLGGILSILGGIGLLGLVSVAQASAQTNGQTLDVPGWITPLAYFLVVVGVVDFVGAILLLMYKRLGLILIGVVTVLTVLINVYNVATQNATISGIAIGTLIDLAILYYIRIYLTREPEKSFFS